MAKGELVLTHQTSAKLEDIVAVISSRLVGASPVSFALSSAIEARKFQTDYFYETTDVCCGQTEDGTDPGGPAQN